VFERFTDDARRAIVYAQEETRLLGHGHIGTEHLLLGLLHDDPAGADTIQVLAQAGVDVELIREHVADGPANEEEDRAGHVPFTSHAKQALEHALRASVRLGQVHLGRAHLLLGVLQVRDARAIQVLRAVGAEPEQLASAAERVAARSEGDVGPAQGAGRFTPIGHGGGRSAQARSMESLSAHANRLNRERRQFALALHRYARHDDDCHPDQGCTCGLGPILALASDD
jgi:ATP-dependent Clp protease ATP-binding subunit ClpC